MSDRRKDLWKDVAEGSQKIQATVIKELKENP